MKPKITYDAISPVTGNQCVLEEADERTGVVSMICMETGYTTTDKLVHESDAQEAYEAGLTELMKEARIIYAVGLCWYPAFMQLPGAMIYPDGTATDFHYEVAEVIDIVGDEREKYPVPGKEGEYFTARLDVENASQFEMKEFETALNFFYETVNKKMVVNAD
jgi:hypothetical protein